MPQQEGLPPGASRREPFPPTVSLAHLLSPGRLRLRGASVSKWKIMAEMACGRKNPCSVAFRQQRGV